VIQERLDQRVIQERLDQRDLPDQQVVTGSDWTRVIQERLDQRGDTERLDQRVIQERLDQRLIQATGQRVIHGAMRTTGSTGPTGVQERLDQRDLPDQQVVQERLTTGIYRTNG